MSLLAMKSNIEELTKTSYKNEYSTSIPRVLQKQIWSDVLRELSSHLAYGSLVFFNTLYLVIIFSYQELFKAKLL